MNCAVFCASVVGMASGRALAGAINILKRSAISGYTSVNMTVNLINVHSDKNLEAVRTGKRMSFKGKGAMQNFFADAYGLLVQREARNLGPCGARNVAKTREDVRLTVCAKLLICEALNNCSNNARR
jgi:hypothetical protein